MRGALAIFAKTPGFSPVKTRLAQTIGVRSAEEFYRKSLCAVEAMGLEAAKISNGMITPCWAVGESRALNHSLWEKFDSIYTGPGTLGQRIYHVYSQLLRHYDFVILTGSDSPQISPDLILSTGVMVTESSGFVMGPARDGGFYLLAGSLPVKKKIFTSISYSRDNTGLNMVNELKRTGRVTLLNVLTDVDTKDDFETLLNELKTCSLPEQKELSAWLHQNNMFSDQIVSE